jgi:lipopolysaccharide biosynthesis protein
MKNHKKIAFYLPQFHEMTENNEFWGEGFTEWTNVRRAEPQYKGHQQPLKPMDNYYDLTNPAVHTHQSKLATEYGIDAFCFYTYWFSGRQLMREVIDLAVANHVDGFKFCLCWANETWSRRWDGQENEILIKQNHDSAKDADYIDDHFHLLQHKNYLRVDGMPILIIYRSDILDKPTDTIKNIRTRARSLGLGELFIVMAQTFGAIDPRESGFDAAVEFPPHSLSAVGEGKVLRDKDFKGNIYDYRSAVINDCRKPIEPYLVLPTVMPGWDNTPRRMRNSTIFANQSVDVFNFWIRKKIEKLESLQISTDKKLLFVNAWNEWAEGSQIEPDLWTYKMERLNALRGGENEFET